MDNSKQKYTCVIVRLCKILTGCLEDSVATAIWGGNKKLAGLKGPCVVLELHNSLR